MKKERSKRSSSFSHARGPEVAKVITDRGLLATPVACDVTDDASVADAFAAAAAIGEIDVVVFNCAPPFPPGRTFASTSWSAINEYNVTVVVRSNFL